jgi:hypothetical protein
MVGCGMGCTGDVKEMNTQMPSYAMQMNKMNATLTGFMRSRKGKIDLPIKRDEFLNDGAIEWTVGYDKENTMNTFTRAEIVQGLTNAIGRAKQYGPKKVTGSIPAEPNNAGIKNVLGLSHIVGGDGVNAGKRVPALFHCLAAARKKIRNAAKSEASANALSLAQKLGTAVGFVTITGRGKNKVVTLSEPYADIKSAVRGYCRTKWTSSWWETTPDMKNARKAEAMNNISNYNDLKKKYS